jgi:hypothetical protein
MSDERKKNTMTIIGENSPGYKKIMEVEVPSNSFKSKEAAKPAVAPERKLEKIIKGTAKKKKKSFGKKMAEVFIGDDVTNVSAYVLYDVLIPAAKNTIVEMIQSGIEMMIFGEARRGKRDRNRSYVSYGSFYKGERDSRSDKPRETSRVSRARHDFDEILLPSRADAEEVLERLQDLVDQYEQATVADFYDLVGVSSTFTDTNWGWKNLSTSYVDRDRSGGFIIRLPRTVELD